MLKPFNVSLVKNGIDGLTMEAAVRRIAENNIPVKTVLDIGASDGKWCLQAMKFLPGAFFYAIEPLQERKNSLERLKQTYSNFDYELCVAGKSDGKDIAINVTSDLDGSTVDGSGGAARKVPVRSIDAIVRENQLNGPFLIKFDTHGYEMPILEGAAETLKTANLVIMEVYNFSISRHALRFHEMCSHMETLGFRCYDMAEPMLRLYDKAFWQMDLLFCREDSEIFAYSGYK